MSAGQWARAVFAPALFFVAGVNAAEGHFYQSLAEVAIGVLNLGILLSEAHRGAQK